MKKVMLKTISLMMAFCLLFTTYAFAEELVEDVELTEISFSQNLDMIKGKYEYVKYSNVDSNTEISLTSSNPKVATVSNDGKISAVKCGKSTITVNAVKDNLSYTAKINVTVEIARNKKTKTYGSKSSQVSDTATAPFVTLPVQLAVKGKTSVAVDAMPEDATVSYKSSDSKIAKVDQNGKITAVKVGTATVTATVKANGNSYKYSSKVNVVKTDRVTTITKKARNKYYSTSAFVGSSIGLGQKYYFDSQGKGYLGNPTMLVRGCYSFMNDKNKVSKYMIQYKGKTMQAKDAIRKAGVDKVFISMGTNDLFKKAESTYNDYVYYLEGIRKKNPKVIIFIESTTSVHASKQKKCLNSKAVKKLNSLMEKYCKTQKDMYFVDVSSRMNDKNGNLSSSCCSDHYVHLTNKAYRIWMEDLTKYTDNLMIQEQNATDAVKTAVESKNDAQIKKAKTLVNALEKSTTKTELNKKLKAIK